MASTETDPLELYDLVYEDSIDLDKLDNGNRTKEFLKKFGNRKHYAEIMGVTLPKTKTKGNNEKEETWEEGDSIEAEEAVCEVLP